MNKYMIFAAFSGAMLLSSEVPAISVKKCIAADGGVTYARTCPAGTDEKAVLNPLSVTPQAAGADSDSAKNSSADTVTQIYAANIEQYRPSRGSASATGGMWNSWLTHRSTTRSAGIAGSSFQGGYMTGGRSAGRQSRQTKSFDWLSYTGLSRSRPVTQTGGNTRTFNPFLGSRTVENRWSGLMSYQDFGSTQTAKKTPTGGNGSSPLIIAENRYDSGSTTTTDTGSTSTGINQTETIQVSKQPDEVNYRLSTIKYDAGNNEIVISGVNFGNKPNIVIYDTFDNGVNGKEIPLKGSNSQCYNNNYIQNRTNNGPRIGCWDEYGAGAPLYSSIAYSGTHSMRSRDSSLARQLRKKFDGTTEVFISYRVLIPPGTIFPGTDKSYGGYPKPRTWPSGSTWKLAWLSDGKVDRLVANLWLPANPAGSKFSIAGNDLSVTYLESGKVWWSWDIWNRLSIWLRADKSKPLAPADIIFQNQTKEKAVYQARYKLPIFDEDGPWPKQFSMIGFPGWMRYTDNVMPHYDDIYIATGKNAVARVEIGDSATYFNSTVLEIQIPTAWTDSYIKIPSKLENRNKLLGSKKYLYITDSNGNVNKEGIDITGLID